jgi:hypothetical protein
MTWEYGGEMSWVEVRLSQTDDGRAHLELEHIALVPEKTWDQFGPGAAGVGWDMAFAGLATHVETGATVDPKEAMAWLGSENARDFIRESSDDWCRASMAFGTDEMAAKAAAARTFAAYTGADASAEHDATT